MVDSKDYLINTFYSKVLWNSELICTNYPFMLFIGVLLYSLVGSIVAVAVERPKFKWLDDDLLMQIFPIMVLTIIYYSGIGPDISLTLENN